MEGACGQEPNSIKKCRWGVERGSTSAPRETGFAERMGPPPKSPRTIGGAIQQRGTKPNKGPIKEATPNAGKKNKNSRVK